VNWAITEKGYSQRRACRLVGIDPRVYRYRSTRGDDGPLRRRLRELSSERRRFGYTAPECHRVMFTLVMRILELRGLVWAAADFDLDHQGLQRASEFGEIDAAEDPVLAA
jgi:hypothetical protein